MRGLGLRRLLLDLELVLFDLLGDQQTGAVEGGLQTTSRWLSAGSRVPHTSPAEPPRPNRDGAETCPCRARAALRLPPSPGPPTATMAPDNGPRARAKGRRHFSDHKAGPGAALVHGSAVPWPVHLLVVPVHPHFVGVILQEALQADPFRGAEDLQRRSGGPCTERDALRPAGSGPAGGLVGRGVLPPGPLRPRLGAQARGPRPPGPSASSRLWPLTPCHTRPSHKHVPHQNDLEDAYAGYREGHIVFYKESSPAPRHWAKERRGQCEVAL